MLYLLASDELQIPRRDALLESLIVQNVPHTFIRDLPSIELCEKDRITLSAHLDQPSYRLLEQFFNFRASFESDLKNNLPSALGLIIDPSLNHFIWGNFVEYVRQSVSPVFIFDDVSKSARKSRFLRKFASAFVDDFSRIPKLIDEHSSRTYTDDAWTIFWCQQMNLLYTHKNL